MKAGQYLKENPQLVIGSLFLVGATLFGGGISNMQQLMTSGNALRESRITENRQLQQLRVSENTAKQEEAIANDRYQRGCVFVVVEYNLNQLVALQEGEPVTDHYTERPISDGNIVCDANGMTGVIKNGVVADPAFTGDFAIVEAALAKRKGAALQRPASSYDVEEPKPIGGTP